MKNKKLLISVILIFSLAAILFSSCLLSERSNTYVCINDCKHGKIEAKCISKTLDYYEFLVTGYPDPGYCLLSENLHIYYYEGNTSISNTPYLNKENAFTFEVASGNKVSISAFFTKINQE